MRHRKGFEIDGLFENGLQITIEGSSGCHFRFSSRLWEGLETGISVTSVEEATCCSFGQNESQFFSFDSDCIETLGAFDQCINGDTCQRDLKNSSCNPIYF